MNKAPSLKSSLCCINTRYMTAVVCGPLSKTHDGDHCSSGQGAQTNSCKPQALTLGQTGTIPTTAAASRKPKAQHIDSFTNTGTKPGHLDSDRQSSQILRNTFSTAPKLKGILSLGKETQLQALEWIVGPEYSFRGFSM